MVISTITTSTMYPIGTSEIKSQIRMVYTSTYEDDFLVTIRNSVVKFTENYINRYLTKRTVKYYLDDFPGCDYIELPNPPVIKVPTTGIVYTNSTGNSTTFGSTKWSQDIYSEPGRVVLNYGDDWPTGITLSQNNPISIEYECGYGSTVYGSYGSSNIMLPDDIKSAMLMICAGWWENREDFTMSEFGNTFLNIPLGAKHLLYTYRIKTF